jgi:hypothetical protein
MDQPNAIVFDDTLIYVNDPTKVPISYWDSMSLSFIEASEGVEIFVCWDQ